MRFIYYIDVRRGPCALIHPKKRGEGGALTLHTNVCVGNIAYAMVLDKISGGLDAKQILMYRSRKAASALSCRIIN
jgi:hypothetical protein